MRRLREVSILGGEFDSDVAGPGYGRSEKTLATYSQTLWADFLRDFVLDIVGEKVVIAGNSIGGFLSASVAADHPELVAGLVLLNSAGEPPPLASPPPSLVPTCFVRNSDLSSLSFVPADIPWPFPFDPFPSLPHPSFRHCPPLLLRIASRIPDLSLHCVWSPPRSPSPASPLPLHRLAPPSSQPFFPSAIASPLPPLPFFHCPSSTPPPLILSPHSLARLCASSPC